MKAKGKAYETYKVIILTDNTPFVRRCFTVQLTSSMAGLDLLLILTEAKYSVSKPVKLAVHWCFPLPSKWVFYAWMGMLMK